MEEVLEENGFIGAGVYMRIDWPVATATKPIGRLVLQAAFSAGPVGESVDDTAEGLDNEGEDHTEPVTIAEASDGVVRRLYGSHVSSCGASVALLSSWENAAGWSSSNMICRLRASRRTNCRVLPIAAWSSRLSPFKSPVATMREAWMNEDEEARRNSVDRKS